jgi:hypothetical protein
MIEINYRLINEKKIKILMKNIYFDLILRGCSVILSNSLGKQRCQLYPSKLFFFACKICKEN